MNSVIQQINKTDIFRIIDVETLASEVNTSLIIE